MVIKMIKSSYDFGKLSTQETRKTINEVEYKYIVFVGGRGVEWHDLVAQHDPFDYFLAVSDAGLIVSMESDPDMTQISGHRIIGIRIDPTFTFTRGQGGDVYGKEWTGENIVDPVPVDAAPDEISRRQFFQQLAVLEIITKPEALAAMQIGAIPAAVQTIVDTLPAESQFEAQMLITGAQVFHLNNPLSEVVRMAMGWTEEQKKQFWIESAIL